MELDALQRQEAKAKLCGEASFNLGQGELAVAGGCVSEVCDVAEFWGLIMGLGFRSCDPKP